MVLPVAKLTHFMKYYIIYEPESPYIEHEVGNFEAKKKLKNLHNNFVIICKCCLPEKWRSM